MTVSDIRIKDNPRYSNTSMKLLHNDTEKQYFMDVDVQIKVEFKNMKSHIIIDCIMEGSNTRRTYLDQIIDCCTLVKHMPAKWELKAIFGDFTKFTYLPETCPIKPGHYYVHNFTTDLKYIPLKIVPKMKCFSSYEYFTIIKKRKVITSIGKVESELRYNDL